MTRLEEIKKEKDELFKYKMIIAKLRQIKSTKENKGNSKIKKREVKGHEYGAWLWRSYSSDW